MIVEGLHHVQLAMPPGGEDEARAFYTGLLDIPEVPKPAPMAARGGVWFERGGLRVHLGVEASFQPARKAHPALEVHGLEELLARLQAAGVEATPGEELAGRRRAFIADPFGNRVEMIESPAARFAVIYRWRIDPARMEDFREAWAAMTRLIRDERQGLGSRLHQTRDGWTVAYAQWPSREAWEASRARSTADAALSQRMQGATLEVGETLELDADLDLLLPVVLGDFG